MLDAHLESGLLRWRLVKRAAGTWGAAGLIKRCAALLFICCGAEAAFDDKLSLAQPKILMELNAA